jgi:exodeoxyribonuclease-5
MAEAVSQWPGAVLCTLTGKAASVLSRKSGLRCSTIHSCIYRFLGEEEDGELAFARVIRDDRWRGRVVFLDESSMVSGEIARDLLATGARIVATGDHCQLPPVGGTGFFSYDDRDFELTQVHRQALESAVLRQATAVRMGGTYESDGADFRVSGFVEADDIVSCDIILCWRNTTRRNLNALKRAHLGLSGPPVGGEPVMCLRNDHEMGVLNGAVYTLVDFRPGSRGVDVTVINERDQEVTLRGCWFEDVDEGTRQARESVGWTFGYAATVHKSQGSEYETVVLVDEYDRAEDRARWVYTGISRAAKRILVQRGW